MHPPCLPCLVAASEDVYLRFWLQCTHSPFYETFIWFYWIFPPEKWKHSFDMKEREFRKLATSNDDAFLLIARH